MEPYYQDNHIGLYAKDCRQMTELADNSVQCVVTSPPYWGLRKYSGEQELIWGDNHCEHQWGRELLVEKQGNWDTWKATDGKGENRFARKKADGGSSQGSLCSLCGAWKGAYGLEPTPEMYVQHTIEILREIRRVLRKDGVVFWNIGDSYASQGGPVKSSIYDIMGGSKPTGYEKSRTAVHSSIKPKDLCLIPFRIAIAAQEDGWWVRSVIIWSKPNPMPESVTDRPTESHEYILLLTKNSRYYWDADAVRESNADPERTNFVSGSRIHGLNLDRNDNDLGERSRGFSACGRNIRTVWEFPTQPYPEAHFAVFPEKLPELCIKAATPEVGCCSKCGAPWERISEVQYHNQSKTETEKYATPSFGTKVTFGRGIANLQTLGWQPSCKCNADKVPSLVLDPFAGAGTTLWVAKKLNRQAVGYEISEEYCRLIVDRCRQQVLL